jgi:hypothetical protein
MKPNNELVGKGAFCLAAEGNIYIVYLADVKETILDIKSAGKSCKITWIDPRTGEHKDSIDTAKDKITLRAPSSGDWAAIIKVKP